MLTWVSVHLGILKRDSHIAGTEPRQQHFLLPSGFHEAIVYVIQLNSGFSIVGVRIGLSRNEGEFASSNGALRGTPRSDISVRCCRKKNVLRLTVVCD